MHSPILFAYTDQAEGLDALKHADSKQKVIDCFVEYGADSDTIFEYLQGASLADWIHDYDSDQGWNAMELLTSLDESATFTPVNDFYGWLEVTPEKCRELLGQSLDAAIEVLTLYRKMLADGVKKVDVLYPPLSSPIPDKNYVDRTMFVTIDNYESIRVGTFDQLVTRAVSRGEGIRLAVAHCFAGDYSY